ncbi:hypothetical protein JL721_13027 [Aureococcus anophagefferens]|nr:hypothetical protein JL721_13027 [Aureococcus anophagefferens]
MAFDYSKWDNIEISDDEADCHPNIDKASWFRMKHRSRVEREDTEAADRKSMEAENRARRRRVRDPADPRGDQGRRRGGGVRGRGGVERRARRGARCVKERADKIDFMEKNKKGTSTTWARRAGQDRAASARRRRVVLNFVEEHEAVLEDYLATRDIEQCKGKIHEHGGTLLHEHARSPTSSSCLEDEMNGYHDKMVLSARNSQILSHYRKGFEEAVAGFASRIENRAVEKRKEMDAAKAAEGGGDDDYEVLSKEARVGPGGLDPVEVFETLPQSMQEAFEARTWPCSRSPSRP